MKNERGSALMTVILIVFVTVVIGAALSSFIMMNYKLRMLDNKIGRAEYETETIVDTAYLAAQEAVKLVIDEQFGLAQTTVATAVETERGEKTVAGVDGNYTYGKVENGVYIDSYNKIVKATNELFVPAYKYYVHSKIQTSIFEKIEDEVNIVPTVYDVNTFGASDHDEIAIILPEPATDVYGRVTENLTIYYHLVGSPIIEISVDFIISTPTYEEANTRSYNLNNLVLITNWSMQDWGYL